ncbi:hypothetical protein TNCV_4275631 [Trichonephila clavipes]|nr:hypothetical protein TNCV_4275631 [Trichonephila clavipes]
MLTICYHHCVPCKTCLVRWLLTENRKMTEQKINLKSYFKLGKTPKETFVILVCVYEDQTLCMKCSHEWFARFREGQEGVSDNPRSGKPAMKTLRKYDPEMKRQSMEWRSPASPHRKNVTAEKSPVKTMIITIFDSQGIIHKEFLPEGTTLTAAR